jgi:hypothetical protein
MCPAGWDTQETIRKMEKGIGGLLKLSRENISQWFSWPMSTLMPMFLLADLFLSFLPCVILRLLLLIKNLTSCTSRDTNLSKTVQRTAMRARTRTQEPEDPAPYNTPCQQEAAKETDASPKFLIFSPYPHHY